MQRRNKDFPADELTYMDSELHSIQYYLDYAELDYQFVFFSLMNND